MEQKLIKHLIVRDVCNKDKNMLRESLSDLLKRKEEKEVVKDEFKVINPDGSEGVMQLPNDAGDEIYIEEYPGGEEAKILSYKKLVKGMVEREKKVINWSDGFQEKINPDDYQEDVLWGEELEKGKVKQIKEKNVKVGVVDRKNKIINFK